MQPRITHFKPFPGIDNKKPHQETVNFKNGQIIKGTVLKKFPAGEILVNAGGRQIRAHTNLKLSEGSEHHFQVNTTGSKIELKLLDTPTARLGLHIRSLSDNSVPRNKLTGILADLSNPDNFMALSGKMTRAFKSLHQYLNSIIYGRQGDNNNLWVTRSILGSGLFWENKILQCLSGKKNGSWKSLMSSDLKGLLLSLEKGIQGEIRDSENIQSLALKIKQALNIIEQDQFLNLSSIREGIGWLINMPCTGKEGFQRAEIFIKKNKKGESLSFYIFLELTQLGRLELKLSIIKSLIGINMFAEDSEKAAFINDNISILEKGLQDLGMSTGSIHCGAKQIKDPVDSDLFLEDAENEPSMHLVI